MSNEIQLNIRASDNGTISKITAEATKLRKELEASQKTASNIRPASQTAAATSARGMDESGSYGLARGTVGTGAAGRDFAKQSQGLGGLVHVYATFAANLFAVSAAFNALSKAADYDNMVKGLDQLGASSGKNLGYMAQSLVKATDNAISLKDAMEATAQASAAGMSTTQISKLGEVAKQASQALGRDMADSLSRLSRGITKVEPELLDELGIFVKVDKAAADYARTIGKTASSLTDYEKRQAFATAALKQAEEKFGSIKLDSNPFSKLMASFTNIMMEGGTVIKDVLSPLINILASSPTALTTVLAGIAGVLLKQAIPALGQWRANLAQAAEESEQKAKRIHDNMMEFNINRGISEAAQAQAMSDAARSRAYDIATNAKLFGQGTKTMYSLKDNTASLDTAREQTAKKIDKVTESLNREKAAMTAISSADANANAIATQKIAQLEAQREEYIALAVAIALAEAEQEKANRADTELMSSRGTAEERAKKRIADRAERSAVSRRISSDVVANTENLGSKEAWTRLNAAIDENKAKLGALQSGYLKVSGAIRIATTTAVMFVQSIQTALFVIGFAVAAFEAFNEFMTKNRAEQEKLKEAVERSASAIKLMSDTIDTINKKPFLDTLNIDSLMARSNAIKEIGDSVEDLVTKFNKVQDTNSGWSNFTNSLWETIGKGNQSEMKAKLTESIISMYKALPEGPAGDAARKSMEKLVGTSLTGVSIIDTKNIDKAIGPEAANRIAQGMKKISEEVTRGVANTKSALDTMGEAAKDSQNLFNSLLPSDNFSKRAINASKSFAELSVQIEDTAKTSQIFLDITSDINKLSLIPESEATKLLKYRAESIDPLVSSLEKLKEEKLALEEAFKKSPNYKTSADLKKKTSEIEDTEKRIKNAIQGAQPELVKAFKAGSDAMVKDISMGLEIAVAKSALLYRSAILSGVTAPKVAIEQASIKNKEIDLGLRQLNATYDLALSQEKLRLTMEDLALVEKEKTASTEKGSDGKSEKDKIKELRTNIDIATKFITGIQEGGNQQLTAAMVKNNTQFAGTYAAQTGRMQKREEAAGQKAVNTLQGKVQSIKDTLSYEESLVAASEKEAKAKALVAQTLADALGIQSSIVQKQQESLLVQQKLNIETDRDNRLKAVADEFAEKSKGVDKKSLTYENLSKSKDLEERKIAADTAEKLAANETANLQFQLSQIDKKYQLQQQFNQTTQQLLDLQSSSIDKQEAANTITKSTAVLKKAELAIQKQELSAASEIASMEEKKKKLTDTEDIAKYEQLIKNKKDQNTLAKEQIRLEAEYQAALLKTEESLRSMEKAGNYTQDYFGTVYQDFTDKVKELSKNAKSAADTFNSGFINAIDSSIDKFFEMLQTGQLKMKDMMSFLRNSLSNVFRDTASQVMKNAWKDALSGIMPESTAEKAQNRLITALDQLRLAVEGKSGTPSALDNTSAGGDISQANYDALMNANNASADNSGATIWGPDGELQQAGEAYKESSNVQTKAAGGFLASAKGMLSAVDGLVSGNLTFSQAMDKIIGNFGGMMPSLFTGIYGAIASALGASSGGGGGGFMGGLLGMAVKGVMAWATGGSSAIAGADMIPLPGDVTSAPLYDWSKINTGASNANFANIGSFNAKGNAFSYADGLAPYSNSIVTSPTVFAFAKGGIPANKGLMGESGPEAILPLRRDASGNLGVRTDGTSGNQNNISINITIESGKVTDSGSQGDQASMAGQLGAAIKMAVNEELIKQSRPGGLLARR